MENNTLNERLGSGTANDKTTNTLETSQSGSLHPSCSPLVDGEIDLLTLSNEELNAMGLLHIGDITSEQL